MLLADPDPSAEVLDLEVPAALAACVGAGLLRCFLDVLPYEPELAGGEDEAALLPGQKTNGGIVDVGDDCLSRATRCGVRHLPGLAYGGLVGWHIFDLHQIRGNYPPE